MHVPQACQGQSPLTVLQLLSEMKCSICSLDAVPRTFSMEGSAILVDSTCSLPKLLSTFWLWIGIDVCCLFGTFPID